MAIDSSMFAAGLAAGTYTAGDVIPLGNIRGPAIVRDGYGVANLKRIFSTFSNSNSAANIPGHIEIKNSNWMDSIANLVAPPDGLALAETSANIQKGHDATLTPNSSWSVNFVVDETTTTTAAQDVIAVIDVDYPSVSAVQNPREAKGTPVTMVRHDSVTIQTYGNSGTANWTSYNVDIFKAGFVYLLTEMGGFSSSIALTFISISGAAGQNGLERIIPCTTANTSRMRYFIDYSTPVVKGPMNINYLPFGSSSGSVTLVTEMDYVRRT